MLLCAANLRTPIVGVGPLLEQIRETYRLGGAPAGLLAALPVAAFAVVSPFCARLIRRHGLEQTLIGAMALLTVGVALRSAGPLAALFAGTAMIGAAIAVGNVLLPSLVMRDFPDRVATITTYYVIVMAMTGAGFSAMAVPLADALGGWRIALGILAAPALLATLAWAAMPRSRPEAHEAKAGRHPHALWRSPLAWQVSGFMAFNSFNFYVLISWLPAILRSKGYSPVEGGALHGLMQAMVVLPLLLLLPLMGRLKDQRAAAFIASACCGVGFLGIAAAPQAAPLWVAIYGGGSGAGLVLALSFSSLRASDVVQAAALAGMSQSVGYVLAAIGPALAGALHDATGSWDGVLYICVATACAQAVIGLCAGRAVTLDSARVAGPLAAKPDD